MAVTIFGFGCGIAALAACVAYAVWYLAPVQKETGADAKDKLSAVPADQTEQ